MMLLWFQIYRAAGWRLEVGTITTCGDIRGQITLGTDFNVLKGELVCL